ncbi:hypothetical protein CTAYLR_000642 [Chrysophaeum taylorii]|uniref:Sugar phosphate transporter domain-containing protein n=1 Tax=Chrysophaeum taylorii TaxID=2483200 RepID=A0AAD7U8P7_9STRA|nr:hypothetical protein CTAYLR_000642 [Chrysophaeum taylorii]
MLLVVVVAVASAVNPLGFQQPALRGVAVRRVSSRRQVAAAAQPVAAAAAATAVVEEKPEKAKVAKLLVFLSLWYAFNGAFNVQNKIILNEFPFPWAVSWVQLASGLLFVLPAWLTKVRTPPSVDAGLLLRFAPIAALHCIGHGLQVSSMGAGSVFFTHVIKATEPLIGMVVVFLFTGTIAPWWVNICLAPIIGGVAFAALKPGLDLSDLWCFASLAAFASTVAFAIAKLLAKQLMSKPMKKAHNLDAANNYGVLTCCSSALLFLPSMLGEGPGALKALSEMDDPSALGRHLFFCGLLYYGYNEMGFRCLDLLSPVSAAVANSLKRVVVLLAAVAFLGETVSSNKILGSSVAMFGVFLYSVAKARASRLRILGEKVPEAVPHRNYNATSPAGTWQP